MKNILKKIAFISTIVLTIWFITLEIKFLVTEKYTVSFFDIFSEINIILISIALIILTVIQIKNNIKIKITRYLLISLISVLLTVFTYSVRKHLNKTNLIMYNQDLGLQSFYLYIDEKKNNYILDYTYPLGKVTIIGKYKKKETIIFFDKNLKSNFKMSDYFTGLKTNSLNLKFMTKIKGSS